MHWVLADAPGVAPEPGAEPEPEPEAAPEPGRRLSEGSFVQILVVGDNPTGELVVVVVSVVAVIAAV